MAQTSGPHRGQYLCRPPNPHLREGFPSQEAVAFLAPQPWHQGLYRARPTALSVSPHGFQDLCFTLTWKDVVSLSAPACLEDGTGSNPPQL